MSLALNASWQQGPFRIFGPSSSSRSLLVLLFGTAHRDVLARCDGMKKLLRDAKADLVCMVCRCMLVNYNKIATANHECSRFAALSVRNG